VEVETSRYEKFVDVLMNLTMKVHSTKWTYSLTVIKWQHWWVQLTEWKDVCMTMEDWLSSAGSHHPESSQILSHCTLWVKWMPNYPPLMTWHVRDSRQSVIPNMLTMAVTDHVLTTNQSSWLFVNEFVGIISVSSTSSRRGQNGRSTIRQLHAYVKPRW